MHGKSMATAAMGWDNRDGLVLAPVRRLPCVPAASEDQMLAAVDAALRDDTVAALFVEPILGSSGGHALSVSCLNALQASCRRRGALLVLDETLTGLYRTGTAFVHEAMDGPPDVVLMGKALGNGFPVSAVVTTREHPVVPQMLPGSTFAGNPLAAAVLTATLEVMAGLDLASRVAAIEACVRDVLGPLQAEGVALRGAGALWVLELPGPAQPLQVVTAAAAAGVLVNHAGRQLRLLPAATTEAQHLERGCRIVAEAIRSAITQ
jgi:acetylornithine/succinyldiaminopimelate/putrescine aminotransferase